MNVRLFREIRRSVIQRKGKFGKVKVENGVSVAYSSGGGGGEG